jgi:hypothetical protein
MAVTDSLLQGVLTNNSFFLWNPRWNVLIQGRFNGNPEFFVYRAFIANSEIIIFLLFNIVPF